MSGIVKRDLRAARKVDTEERVLAAAARLFVDRGYARATLADVADEAGVSARTVYVRFGTKAALLSRAIGVALVGDTAPQSVAERSRTQQALTAPTAEARIDAFCRLGRDLLARAGGLLAVAAQAEPVEPQIAIDAQAGRVETRRLNGELWAGMVRDGLLPATADVQWLTDTSTLLGSADTYLQIQRLHAWDSDTYERWLRTSLHRLRAAAVPADPVAD